jgi:putative ABC transport system permease protein
MRRVFLNLRIASRSLLHFKLRSALAVLGVFLGAFSLIIVSNLSDSLALKTEIEAENLGKNLLIVRSGLVRRFGPNVRLLSEATTLTVQDARALHEGTTAISGVAPTSNTTFPVRYRGTALTSVLTMGVTPEYMTVRNLRLREGRFITGEDNAGMEKVAVIGTKVAENLFRDQDPIGKYILIWRVPCQVVGILEEKGVDVSGLDQDNQVMLPLNTFLRRFVNKQFINSISVQVASESALPRVKEEIEHILRERHRIGDGQPDFSVIDLKDVMEVRSQAVRMITTLGRIAAGVSFTIGGLGILSIMILIVNERRVEIGIRRAVGSTRRDIIQQFLLESSFISLLGGTGGVVLSVIATTLILRIANLPFAVSIPGHIFAFFASVAVGILAGIYPSQKATRIQPVDVIRM